MKYRYLLLLLAFTLPAQAAEVSSQLQGNTLAVLVDGQIWPGDEHKLATVLDNSSARQVNVMLNSPGGDVDVAFAMGRRLRAAQAATYYKYCASSCALIYMGGVRRSTGYRPGMVMRVHRPQLAEAYVARPDSFSTAMMKMFENYVVEMTGSDAYYKEMMAIPFSAPKDFSPGQLVKLGVSTEIIN